MKLNTFLEYVVASKIDNTIIPMDLFFVDIMQYDSSDVILDNEQSLDLNEDSIDIFKCAPMIIPKYRYRGHRIKTSYKPISKMLNPEKIIIIK